MDAIWTLHVPWTESAEADMHDACLLCRSSSINEYVMGQPQQFPEKDPMHQGCLPV